MAARRTKIGTMEPGRRLETDERRAKVLRFFAEHPDATYREAAAALNMAKTTVASDFKIACSGIVDRAREAYIGVIVNRNERMIEAHMPFALAGKTFNTQAIVMIQDQTIKIFGLFAPTKTESTINIQAAAEQIAKEYGLDAGDVLAEADRIVATGAGT